MLFFDKLVRAFNGENESGVEFLKIFRSKEKPLFPACAIFSSDEKSWIAAGLMKTAHPANKVKKDNQQTWLNGDVFEVFLQLPGHQDYYEFHTTPEGHKLQLHLPDAITFRDLPHKKKICEVGLQVRNVIEPKEMFWYCELRIPFAGLQVPNNKCRFAFARYDYTDFEEKPEISTYPYFPETVHTPDFWIDFQ
ncbi:MAG: hypothetical protein E7051_09040 [Lentisphaerae bacterium]|nr:hypothetical protein [Lentisphaerota bacterium]